MRKIRMADWQEISLTNTGKITKTDKKIFLVSRSFSKEKTSGKGLLFIVERKDKTEELEYYCKVNMRLLSFLRACKIFDENIRDVLLQGVNEQVLDENKDNNLTLTDGKASLMHVSEEEKCVELTSEELELLKKILLHYPNFLLDYGIRDYNKEEFERTKALLKKLEAMSE